MILEVAILEVIPTKIKEFEEAFLEAQKIISVQKGYISHDLQKCIEQENKYILLVQWETLEDHEIGFRQSSDYQQWKELLHRFYNPFPTVEHYKSLNFLKNTE